MDVEATEVLPGSFQGSDENAGGSEEISTEHAEGDEGGREAAAAGPPLSTVSGGDRGGGSVAEALFASSVLPPPSPGGRRGPAAGGAGLDGCGVPQEKLEVRLKCRWVVVSSFDKRTSALKTESAVTTGRVFFLLFGGFN